jgi:hypothetical protein
MWARSIWPWIGLSGWFLWKGYCIFAFQNMRGIFCSMFDFQLHNKDSCRMGLFMTQFIYTVYILLRDCYANVYFKT